MSNKPDLQDFEGLGKIPWEKRSKLIKEKFPSVGTINWEKAFTTDIDLMGSILKDVLKEDLAIKGRPGPRAAIPYEEGMARLKQYMGDDYTVLAFPEAFKALAAGRSIRHLCGTTGLDRTLVFRLLNGKVEPDAYVMQEIAKGFKKDPSYFAEYRLLAITKAVADSFDRYPETSINVYRKLMQDGSN